MQLGQRVYCGSTGAWVVSGAEMGTVSCLERPVGLFVTPVLHLSVLCVDTDAGENDILLHPEPAPADLLRQSVQLRRSAGMGVSDPAG